MQNLGMEEDVIWTLTFSNCFAGSLLGNVAGNIAALNFSTLPKNYYICMKLHLGRDSMKDIHISMQTFQSFLPFSLCRNRVISQDDKGEIIGSSFSSLFCYYWVDLKWLQARVLLLRLFCCKLKDSIYFLFIIGCLSGDMYDLYLNIIICFIFGVTCYIFLWCDKEYPANNRNS